MGKEKETDMFSFGDWLKEANARAQIAIKAGIDPEHVPMYLMAFELRIMGGRFTECSVSLEELLAMATLE